MANYHFEAITQQGQVIEFTLRDLLDVLQGTGTVSAYPSEKNMRDLMRMYEYDTSLSTINMVNKERDND